MVAIAALEISFVMFKNNTRDHSGSNKQPVLSANIVSLFVCALNFFLPVNLGLN